MSWSVEWSKGARKDIDRLDADVARRVVRAVDRLAETAQGDVKKLKNMGGLIRTEKFSPHGDRRSPALVRRGAI